MSTSESELPAIRTARETRVQWDKEQAEQEARRVPAALSAAAQAFDGWYDTLRGELGRTPSPEEQADRFDHLAKSLVAQVTQHADSEFWEMLPDDPAGATLRLLLVPPRTNFRRDFLALLATDDSLAFNAPLYALPGRLGTLVDDYFTLRGLPSVLTLADLQVWLRHDRLSLDGRRRLATMRPEVGELRTVLEEAGETCPEFEFAPRGIDALVDRYFVHVHKGTREEYLALPVPAALSLIENGPLPQTAVAVTEPQGDEGVPTGRTTRTEAVEKIRTHHSSRTEKQKGAMTVRGYAKVGGCSIGLASGILNDLGIPTKGKTGEKAGKLRTVQASEALLAVVPSTSTNEFPEQTIELLRSAIGKHGVENLVKVAELYATQDAGDNV